jgi:large subunit ribosomal protein L24e
MPRTRECDFCGADIEPGTGTMFVSRDGTTTHFCSSKCEKNADLGREARDLEWTASGRPEETEETEETEAVEAPETDEAGDAAEETETDEAGEEAEETETDDEAEPADADADTESADETEQEEAEV